MKIAVIEDEKPIREGLVHILNKISPEYQVVGSAENGAEGLILLEEEMPDLIMLDIQMPDMDGLQMLKEARARGIYTKVIILTAYSDFSYAKKAIELGIENYLLKPVNLTELKKTLEKIKEELFVEQRGKNSLSLEKILKDILDGEYEKNERLDAVLAAMLHCSRGQASELIEAGRVEINHLPADKPHAQVYVGDVFSVRGKGRFRLTALPGKSKKDRSIIEFFQY